MKGFDELQRQAATWAPKQKAKVEEAVEKLKYLAQLPFVKSVTLLSGKSMGTAFALPDAYDMAMQSHAEALAGTGVVLVDPFPLHNLTDRYDNFHMEATAQNMSGTTRWYYALMSGILHDRQIRRASMEIAASSRKIIFDLHFRKGNQQEGYNVPPITDLILSSNVVFGVEPPQARHPDEEIVIDTPITQHEPLHWEQLDPEDFDNEFMRTMAQEVTETDRVFLNPDLDAEVTITVEPTDTVQQTVTEILGDVTAACRKTEPLLKSSIKRISRPFGSSTPRTSRPSTSPRSPLSQRQSLRPSLSPSRCQSVCRHHHVVEARADHLLPLHAEALDALIIPKTSTEYGLARAISPKRA